MSERSWSSQRTETQYNSMGVGVGTEFGLQRSVCIAALAGVASMPLTAAAAPAAQAVKSSGSCADRQSVSVDLHAGWRCQVSLTREQAYLIRVEQRDLDVVVTVVGPKLEELLAVDAPTRRASPELVLLGPQLQGNYSVVVRPANREAPGTRVDVTLNRLQAGSAIPLVRGLKQMMLAAAPNERQAPDVAERSIKQLRAALPDFIAAGSRQLEAETRLRIAAAYYWTIRDYNAAASAAEEAMQAFDRVPDPTKSAQAANLRGASLAEVAGTMRQRGARAAETSDQAQFDETVRLLENAAKQFHTAGMKYDEAHALNNLGVAFHYQGEHAQARAQYVVAARLFNESGEHASEALPLQNIAVLDYDRGDYAEAAASYQRLLSDLDPEHDRSDYVAILNNLGTVQYVLGNTDQALATLSEGLRLTGDGTLNSHRARTLHALGRTYLIIGEHERGAVYLEQALELRRAAASQDRRGLLISLIRNGDFHREQGESKRALELHLQALDQVVSAEERTRVLLAVGLDQMATGSTPAAVETLARALKLELPEDWPVRASVTGAYGYALLQEGNRDGRALLERAARIHETSGDDELAARDYYLLATVDQNAAQRDAALRNVAKALSLYESQRLRAVNPDLRATYVSSRADAYSLQVELYMEMSEGSRGAERSRLQSAALASAESLRVHALNDFRQFAQAPAAGKGSTNSLLEIDSRLATKRHRLAVAMEQTNPSATRIETLRRELALLRTEADIAQGKRVAAARADASPAALSIAELQRSQAPDAVLLTWLLGEQRSWLLSIAREKAQALPLGSRRELEQAARDLYALWSTPMRAGDSAEIERKASRAILGSSTEWLTGTKSISVVAEGALRTIPVGALWVARGGTERRLAETHLVTYRPSLGHLGDSSRARGVETERRMLLVGDPVPLRSPAGAVSTNLRGNAPGIDSTEFQRLPASRLEIEQIVRIAQGWQADVLMGEKATKAAVLAQPLAKYQVLHFATHARLDVHDPQLSAIVLSSPRAPAAPGDGSLSLREILGLELHADTVVLSACEGSLGKEYRGQLSFGLSEAFLLAGAENVLASLWRVSDVATERYMQSFYAEYIRQGLSPGAAVQAAARTMMSDPTYGHPFYWAAFVLLSV